MASTELKTRIILSSKTTNEWASDTTVILKGEIAIDISTRKIKIGDGVNVYKDLPFATVTPEDVNSLIQAASHTHNNKTILDATTASFTTELKTKLDGITTGATRVIVDSSLSDTSGNAIANKAVKSALDTKVDKVSGKGLSTNDYTTAEKNKLAGIAEGANKTVVDSAMSSTSTNPVQNKIVQAALDGKVPTARKVNGKALSADITLSAADVSAIPTSQKGTANGVASLDANGKVPSAQLPSYVDDVIEGYYNSNKFYSTRSGSSGSYTYSNEITGESGKIYVNLENNKTYRWSGSAYVVISETIALGETSSTAYRGDRGKIAYDHSQTAHAPSNAERNVLVGIQKNGTDITVDSTSRKANITVPTKTSELTNDSGFITSSGSISKANQLTTARPIDGVNFNGTAGIIHFAECSTEAATQAKVVNLSGFALATGARVTVKFTATNTAANPTLNVNSTGAKGIMYRGSAITAGILAANRVYEFVYDGTDYELVGDLDTNTNTDTKVKNTAANTTKAYVTGVNATYTSGSANEQVYDTGVYLDTTAGTLTATTFKGALTGNVTGNVSGSSSSCTGNSATASKAAQLTTARTIALSGAATGTATSFNGTTNISIPVISLNAGKLTQTDGDYLILNGNF